MLLLERRRGRVRLRDAYNLLGLSLALVDRRWRRCGIRSGLAQNPRTSRRTSTGVLLNGLGGRRRRIVLPRSSAAGQHGFPAVVEPARERACCSRRIGAPGHGEAVANTGARWICGLVRRYPLSLARTLLDAQRYGAADELDQLAARRICWRLLLRGLAAYFTGALNTASASWDRAAGVDPADRRVAVYRSMLARKQGGPLDG